MHTSSGGDKLQGNMRRPTDSPFSESGGPEGNDANRINGRDRAIENQGNQIGNICIPKRRADFLQAEVTDSSFMEEIKYLHKELE